MSKKKLKKKCVSDFRHLSCFIVPIFQMKRWRFWEFKWFIQHPSAKRKDWWIKTRTIDHWGQHSSITQVQLIPKQNVGVFKIKVYSVRAAFAKTFFWTVFSDVRARFLQVHSHPLSRLSVESDGTIYDKLGEVRAAPESPKVQFIDLDLVHPSAYP